MVYIGNNVKTSRGNYFALNCNIVAHLFTILLVLSKQYKIMSNKKIVMWHGVVVGMLGFRSWGLGCTSFFLFLFLHFHTVIILSNQISNLIWYETLNCPYLVPKRPSLFGSETIFRIFSKLKIMFSVTLDLLSMSCKLILPEWNLNWQKLV